MPFPGAPTPPDVWIPESTTSVALLRARTGGGQAARRADAVGRHLAGRAGGADRRAAAARRPGRQPAARSRRCLARLGDPRGWGQPGLDHPEWGPIKVTTTDPGSTPLGTGMLLALVGVQTQTPTPDVERGRVPSARTCSRRCSGWPARCSATAPSGDAADGAGRPGQHGRPRWSPPLGLIAAYEQDVWKYDRDSPAIVLSAGVPGRRPARRRLPVRGAEGQLGRRRRPGRRRRLPRLAAVGRRAGPARPVGAAPAPTAWPARRSPPACGSDSTLPLAPVPQQAVDGPTAARTAWRLLTRRISVLGLFDVSGSMADPVPGSRQSKLDVARAAAQAALGFFDPQDSIGLWEFSRQLDGDRDYRVLVPLGPAGAAGRAVPEPAGRVGRRVPADGAADLDRALRQHPGRATRARPRTTARTR